LEIVPQDKLWKRLEEIMDPLKTRIVVTRIYKNVIVKLRTTEGWTREIT